MTRLTPEREKQIRGTLGTILDPIDIAEELLAEIDALRDDYRETVKIKIELAAQRELYQVKWRTLGAQNGDLRAALHQVMDLGERAQAIGTADSHSFNLGCAMGVAAKGLAMDDLASIYRRNSSPVAVNTDVEDCIDEAWERGKY